MWDLFVKNGQTIVDIDGRPSSRPFDLAVKEGKIVALGENLAADGPSGGASEVIDAKGWTVLPGVIDSQVHFRWPGLTDKEDIAHGSRAAVLGGVATYLEMPNTKPSTTDARTLAAKLAQASENSWANFGFFIGANGKNLGELVVPTPGRCGVKIFLGSSTGDLLLTDEGLLREIFSQVSGPIAIHSEDERILKERESIRRQGKSAHAHLRWRNVASALKSTEKVLQIARQTGKKIHILHVSTKEEMLLLKDNKDICTVEVTPQHLSLSAPDCYDRLGTYAQMNPPIRTLDHQEALWEGIATGVVDVIGSDHAPHTREEKDRGYPQAPSGMPGVQTLLPLMLDHVHRGRLTLERLVELLCSGPARLYRLKSKGRIAIGADGDLTIVDLKKKHTLSHKEMASKCGWTPFDGQEVVGMPVATILSGKVVMKNGEISGPPRGRPILPCGNPPSSPLQ